MLANTVTYGRLEGTIGLLAEKELQAALCVCAGLANKEIAKVTGTAPSTVKKSIERVFFKLGVSSRSAIAAELFCRGIAKHLVIVLCALLVMQVCEPDKSYRTRRPFENKIESRMARGRIEAGYSA